MELLALYGTLMSPFATLDELGARRQLRLIGACQIRGMLFDVGEWPSLLAGEGVAHGELFEVLSATVFERLDPFEDYDPADRARSVYLRERVRLLRPELEAWVYVANTPLNDARHIPSGSWREWLAGQGPSAGGSAERARSPGVPSPPAEGRRR